MSHATPPQSATAKPDSVSPGPRLPLVWKGAALGTCAALLAALGLIWWRAPPRLPDLTENALRSAIQRWDESGPDSYRLLLELKGRQPGTIEIEVHEGEVTHFTRDGVVPRQRRTWEYWTVPNQLATIEQDWDSAHDPHGGFGAPPGTRVVQRAEFDARWGFPRQYQRFVLGTPFDVVWEITEFQPLE